MVSSGMILSNRYLIVRELGSGGMGSVYEATDLRTGGTVAVKTLHAHFARDAQFVRRLRREAQIAASIRTPRAVKVIDLDEHAGTHFLVMEYVTGENLSDKLERVGRLPMVEALDVCTDITRALEGAHAAGVVHRDLKPQNVRLTDEGEVKVLDFGIARVEDQPGITSSGIFTGTPEYCAPERLDAQGDVRADIYSIGIMLYELLAGRRPFTGPTAFSVLRQHEIAPVPPLPVVVPAELQAVIDRCLAKQPDDRFQTPAALLTALRAARAAVDGTGNGARAPLAPARAPQGAPAAVATAELQPGHTTVERAPGAVGPTPKRRTASRRLALIGGGALLALVVLGGVALAAGRGSSGNAPAAATVEAESTTAALPTAAGSVTRVATPAALLAAGKKVALDIVDEAPISVAPELCPGAKGPVSVRTVLRISSIESDGQRIFVTYSLAVPEVPGVQCNIGYLPDAGTGNIVLVTAKPSGIELETTTVGGAGLAVTGAPQIYGKQIDGVWAFDNVDLDGAQLSLLQRQRDGSVLHRVKLLSR